MKNQTDSEDDEKYCICFIGIETVRRIPPMTRVLILRALFEFHREEHSVQSGELTIPHIKFKVRVVKRLIKDKHPILEFSMEGSFDEKPADFKVTLNPRLFELDRQEIEGVFKETEMAAAAFQKAEKALITLPKEMLEFN